MVCYGVSMSKPDITIPVLKRTREILRKRGWNKKYINSVDGALNIRAAIAMACREIAETERQEYVSYCRAVSTLSLFLKDGVTSWEFGTHARKSRPRKEQEVFELFDKVIEKLESGEKRIRSRTTGNGISV